jgi:hypothetical protein
MKAGKKLVSIKQKIREERKKEQRIGIAVTVAILIAIVLISGFLINSMLNQPSTIQTVSSTEQAKAAIVDQLSLTFPNQTFTQAATSILKQAGYTVDYYPGEQVTVDFYRNLPTHDYSVVILRVHSTISRPGTPRATFLFSSEPYTQTKYVYEQLDDRVVRVAFADEGPFYFGISPLFTSNSMHGNFKNAVIVMMGCCGLEYTSMAQAFIKKGAGICLSWNSLVFASHTDTATISLLQHLITGKQTIKQAVENTMKEVGPDPVYQSQLIYYPLEAGEQTIENLNG